VTIQLDLQSTLHEPRGLANVIAELPGSSRKDEIVFIGAHLDSWHGGTGATDNAAGVAVVMEAMRILKALNLPTARTVRAAFWSMEEMGTRGSRAYVRIHKGELNRIICYINMDHGAGRIRGAFFSDEQIRERLVRWLEPVGDLEAKTLSPRLIQDSDHGQFMNAGVMSISLLQDKLRYETLTHHSAMDVYDYLLEDDLKQAAAVVATLLYEAAQDGAPAPTAGK
jgi:Zn-dependent M28 family amino/carboxypeptidase